MTLPVITKRKGKLKGVRVLVRVSLNVPIASGRITNDYRLRQILPTLRFLRAEKARTILVSHSGNDARQSFRFVVQYLQKHFDIGFLPGTDLARAEEMSRHMKEGTFLLLDNIRRFPGETTSSKTLAKRLARLGDVYVNEDFAVSHRAHASVVELPKLLPAYVGPRFALEEKEIRKLFRPSHPFLVILGGAKFETKLPLVKKLLRTADHIFIGGALVNSFYQEMGYEIGRSLADRKKLGLMKLARNPKIILPRDVVIESKRGREIKVPAQVSAQDTILDIGPESIEELHPLIRRAKLILWNGPMGNFEKGFTEATETLASHIARSKAHSVVGGGDTIAAIEKLGLFGDFSFVSTGGGALLDYIAKEKLPGIEAIERSRKRVTL